MPSRRRNRDARVASIPVNSIYPTKGIFSGTFAQACAQMEWEAAPSDFTFQPDPLETSQSTFAEIGQGDQRLLYHRSLIATHRSHCHGRLAGQQRPIRRLRCAGITIG
jgi:hypothetical protein